MTHHVPSYPGSPHEDHWPSYDPVDHRRKHHPKHPPYMVDRCADQCDDQLPLFSQVGRGLQGDGYYVGVTKSTLTETELTGFFLDPRTGEKTRDWISENINGGHLSFGYNLRNWTDPQTFTISFRYVRPGRYIDAEGEKRSEGTVWSWVSPAIPYSYNEYNGNIGSGVATLYLKEKAEGAWPTGEAVTRAWLDDHEKLKYPPDMDHWSMNAPDPLEPYTVNLEYGIGGDFNVPSLDDLAKIIGVSPDFIKQLVTNPVPTDTFGMADGKPINVKQYIDKNRAKVISTKPKQLSVTEADMSGGGTEFKLTPIAPKAGNGINITESDGELTIANTGVLSIGGSTGKINIVGGPGIDVSKKSKDGVTTFTISDSDLSGTPKTLVAGRDFDYKVWNGFFWGERPDDAAQRMGGDAYDASDPNNIKYAHPSKSNFVQDQPKVTVIPVYSPDDGTTIIGGQVSIENGSTIKDGVAGPTVYLQQAYGLLERVQDGVNTSPYRFRFAHGATIANRPQAAILSLKFKGIYAELNNKRLVNIEQPGSNIWNTKGAWLDSSLPDSYTTVRTKAVDWSGVGGNWEVSYRVGRGYSDVVDPDTGSYNFGDYEFLVAASGIADGWNDQYATPRYVFRDHNDARVKYLFIDPFANFSVRFSLV